MSADQIPPFCLYSSSIRHITPNLEETELLLDSSVSHRGFVVSFYLSYHLEKPKLLLDRAELSLHCNVELALTLSLLSSLNLCCFALCAHVTEVTTRTCMSRGMLTIDLM